ncbi:hypothetical protein D3C71_725020 [compost metagenome]
MLPTLQIQLVARLGVGADAARGFDRIEADLHQGIGQFAGHRAKALGGYVSVGLVHRLLLASSSVGHAKHAPQQLLDVLVTLDLCHRAKHIGEGAIPPFLERLLGDDDLNWAILGEQIQSVDTPMIAGGNCNGCLRNLLDIHQVLLDLLYRGRSFGAFSLDEQNWTDVVRLAQR